ncbi:hypothetical protein KIH74_16970 [Kineosporia sp. J2-2]|uniref:Uncharacterized protein n=1 Tax=Kineosporia corallincola TaxID=2835133 RepID=A0ABS5TKP1_9ACTN|nr:hypothetical protein [Kineosporia corallincola]MBT0770638.1 hypothetical protein [Kineosporia corallincola]
MHHDSASAGDRGRPHALPDRRALAAALPEPGTWQPFPRLDRNRAGLDTAVREAADRHLATPWPTTSPTTAPTTPHLLERLAAATLAAHLTGEQRFFDDVVHGVRAVCDRSSRCRPGPRRPCPDLLSTETAALLAWVDHLLGDRVRELRELIAGEVRQRVLEPYRSTGRAVHAGVVPAALQLAASREQLLDVLDRTVHHLGHLLGRPPGDGFPAAAVTETLEWIRLATGLDGFSRPELVEVAERPPATLMSPHQSVDIIEKSDLTPHLLYLLGTRLELPEVRRHALALREPHPLPAATSLGRTLLDLADPAWSRDIAQDQPGFPYPARTWLPGSEVLTVRRLPGGTEGVFLAVRGGHNGGQPSRGDVGTVVIGWDGEPLVIGAAHHNVPVVNGHHQAAGRRHRAVDVSCDIGRHGAGLTLDLAPAYPDEAGVRSLRRRVLLDRAPGWVVLRDRWDLTAPASLHWPFMLRHEPRPVAPGELELVHGVVLAFPEGLSVEVSEVRPAGHGAPLFRLDLGHPEPGTTGVVTFTVRLRF